MNFHLPQFHTNFYNSNFITLLPVGYLLVSQARLFLVENVSGRSPPTENKSLAHETNSSHGLTSPMVTSMRAIILPAGLYTSSSFCVVHTSVDFI